MWEAKWNFESKIAIKANDHGWDVGRITKETCTKRSKNGELRLERSCCCCSCKEGNPG